MRNLGCPISSGRLHGYLIRQSEFVIYQGQRYPLTAEMSSDIWDKTSFNIIMRLMLSIYIDKSI